MVNPPSSKRPRVEGIMSGVSIKESLLRGKRITLEPSSVGGQVSHSVLMIPSDVKDERAFACTFSEPNLNPFVLSLVETFGLESILAYTSLSMIGARETDPFSEDVTTTDVEKSMPDAIEKYVAFPEITPETATNWKITKIKAIVAALAVGKTFIEESLDQGLSNRMSALMASLGKSYTKMVEAPFSYGKYQEYKNWIAQFPLLMTRIVRYLRYPTSNLNDLTKAIFAQADILNQNSGMTQIFITHNFLMTAEVRALTLKAFEQEMTGFLDQYEKISEKYSKDLRYLGICLPGELIPLQKCKFEKLYTVAHHWFTEGTIGSRLRLKFESSTTISKEQLRSYLQPVNIRTGEGGRISATLASRIGVQATDPKDLESLVRSLLQDRVGN